MNLRSTNPNDKGAKYIRNEKSTGSEFGQSRHKPTADASVINKAVDRAIKDKVFFDKALESIKKIKFPVYKIEIIDYLKKATNRQ
jgi:tryptophan synthase alpha subunit